MSSSVGGLLAKNSLHLVMRLRVKQIGDRIKSLRRSRIPEITSEELAARAGLSRQTVSRIENGKNPAVSIISIDKIAKALGVPITSILNDDFAYIEMAAESAAEYKTKKRNNTN